MYFADYKKDLGFLIGNQSEAGFDVGYVILEIHYDNYDFLPNVHDSSGVRLIMARTPVLHPASMISVADPYASCDENCDEEQGCIPKDSRGVELTATCPTECTTRFSHPINVFASKAHMHLLGRYLRSTIIPGGGSSSSSKRPVVTSTEEYFHHEFQHFRPESFMIYPGDQIVTQCIFDNDNPHKVDIGDATEDEMCMHVLYYWPRLPNNMMLCGKAEQKHAIYCGPPTTENLIFLNPEQSKKTCQFRFNVTPDRIFGTDGGLEVDDDARVQKCNAKKEVDLAGGVDSSRKRMRMRPPLDSISKSSLSSSVLSTVVFMMVVVLVFVVVRCSGDRDWKSLVTCRSVT